MKKDVTIFQKTLHICFAGCFLSQTGEVHQQSASSPTFLCSQSFLSHLPFISLSPSCSLSLTHSPFLSSPSSHSTAETIINYPYPSMLSFPQSPSIFPAHPAEWFLLVGCGPPNPVPVSHPAPGSWAETDSSVSKSIIIFSQCNPIPEDIL